MKPDLINWIGKKRKTVWTRTIVKQRYRKRRMIKNTPILQLFFLSISIKVRGTGLFQSKSWGDFREQLQDLILKGLLIQRYYKVHCQSTQR